MTRAPEEQAVIDRFDKRYERAGAPVMQDIERSVCGCDYGATSWTTVDEANAIARTLDLGPGKRLLEIGAGSGWPGLYLAERTGCDVALIDLPPTGLRMARERALTNAATGACWIAAADGTALPFRDGSVDAIVHTDVLCCLPAKERVLDACRKVIGDQGRMVFSVIYVRSRLSVADHADAVECGPPFIDAPHTYPELLARTGWRLDDVRDMTTEYCATVDRVADEQMRRTEELSKIIGDDGITETKARHRATADALDRGLIQRALFTATPEQ